MKLSGCLISILGAAACFPGSSAAASSDKASFIGPDSVGELLQKLREKEKTERFPASIKQWKNRMQREHGFSLGMDYNSIYLRASRSPGRHESGSGVFRIYGDWQLTGRGTPNTGSLVFKVEHRHAYGSLAPTDLGFEIGYAGLLQSTFSDQGLRTTNLYWKQKAADGNLLVYAGFVDVTDYVDVHILASPWESFDNLVFATGSATMAGLPDGALGAMAATWLGERVYLVAGIADANASPTDVFHGFKTLFSDFETFKTLELGMTSARENLFFDNVHATLWQIDARKDAGTPRGWGLNFSASTTFGEQWLAFLRGGWSHEGNSLLSSALSIGAGHQQHPGESVLGIGFNWGRPNQNSFPGARKNQYTAEFFYRWQAMPYLQVTPDLQAIRNPAMLPDADTTWVLGIRLRVSL